MNIFHKVLSITSVLGLSLMLMTGCKTEDEEDPIETPTPTVEKGITFSSNGSLTISLNHQFNGNALQLSPVQYVTTANDTIKITQLTYYITNIVLTTKQGAKVNLGNANLVDFIPPGASSFTINNVPAGNYTNISYLIGVDSTRNSTGTNQGDLDPNNGMYWSWNTGYVFVRIKGRFSSSETGYSFDIGGTSNIMSASHSLMAFEKSGTSAKVMVDMDVANIFNTPNVYNLKTDSLAIHDPTSPAIQKLRPNISGAFTLQSVQ
jgi:hypothetical protein